MTIPREGLVTCGPDHSWASYDIVATSCPCVCACFEAERVQSAWQGRRRRRSASDERPVDDEHSEHFECESGHMWVQSPCLGNFMTLCVCACSEAECVAREKEKEERG
jgi:hypothetical protein